MYRRKRFETKHTGLKSFPDGLLRGTQNLNVGLKSSKLCSTRKSTQPNRSSHERVRLQSQMLMVSNNDDPCPTLLNWMLYEKGDKYATKLIDRNVSENAVDYEIDDASNKLSKEDASCSNSIDLSDVQFLDTQTTLQCDLSPTQISSLIKNEMKLKIQCRRVQEGLPEMPDMQDNSQNTIALCEEEKQRQQQRLNSARQASKNYRRKFKSRETQLKEAFKCELQQRTQLQQEITLLKQTKDALNKRLQGHYCKHVSTAGVVDVCSSIHS